MSLWVYESVGPWHAKNVVFLFMGLLRVHSVVVVIVGLSTPTPPMQHAPSATRSRTHTHASPQTPSAESCAELQQGYMSDLRVSAREGWMRVRRRQAGRERRARRFSLMCGRRSQNAEVSPRRELRADDARRDVERVSEHRLCALLLSRQGTEERMREREEEEGVALTQHVELLLHQALMCKSRVVSTQQLTLSPPSSSHTHSHYDLPFFASKHLLPNGDSRRKQQPGACVSMSECVHALYVCVRHRLRGDGGRY